MGSGCGRTAIVHRLRETSAPEDQATVLAGSLSAASTMYRALQKEVGENFAGFAEEALMEETEIGGRFGADVMGFGVTRSVGRKAGGGFDSAGRADGKEDRAIVESGKDFAKLERSLAEPADVRANLSAAWTARNFGGGLVESCVFERRAGACVAAGFEELAVHVQDTRRAGLFVEIVDVLRAKEQAVGEFLLQCGHGVVGGVRSGVGGSAAAHGVKIPDRVRVAAPGLRGGDLFETVVAPDSPSIAEGGDAAFGGDAGPGEEEDAVGRGED